MTNFYEKLGCDNKEELYGLIKNNDASVREIVEFLNYSKSIITNNHKAITCPENLVYYAKSLPKSSQERLSVIFTNTKNYPIHYVSTDLTNKNELQRVISEGLNSGGVSAFFYKTQSSLIANTRMMELEETLKYLDIEVLDTLIFNEQNNTFKSSRANEIIVTDNKFNYRTEKNMTRFKKLKQKDEVLDFTKYFCEKELKGRNIIKDTNLVNENLKIGYQFADREIFGVILYDGNDKILDIKELFFGGVNSAVVDSKIVFKNILREQKAKGFAIFHNHPSGIPDPSREDLLVTKKLLRISDSLNVEFLDHYIIGTKRVHSLVKNNDIVSSRDDYIHMLQNNVNRHKQVLER